MKKSSIVLLMVVVFIFYSFQTRAFAQQFPYPSSRLKIEVFHRQVPCDQSTDATEQINQQVNEWLKNLPKDIRVISITPQTNSSMSPGGCNFFITVVIIYYKSDQLP